MHPGGVATGIFQKGGGLLARLAEGLTPADVDHYLVRDAQRAIEAIESLVRIHNAQEEDIYEHAARG